MKPEINFVYFSKASNSSWKIILINDKDVHIVNMDNNEEYWTTLDKFNNAIKDGHMSPHDYQNEYLKLFNPKPVKEIKTKSKPKTKSK